MRFKVGDKLYCKFSFHPFKKGSYYGIKGIHSIFSDNDYIAIKYHTDSYRFKLKESTFGYIDNYLDSSLDPYLFDYFCDIKEDRINKLKKLERYGK